jgi:hypothetical protein
VYDVWPEPTNVTSQLQERPNGTPERHVADVISRGGQRVSMGPGLSSPRDDGGVHADLGPKRAGAFEHHLGAARPKFGEDVYDTQA